jgi:anti-sigma-K factor RskA/putative zinc finger protein
VNHVIDDLELYSLGALPAADTERVGQHLAACPTCRAAATDVADVVALLPEAIPLREPPASLKVRILEAARADTAPRFAFRLPWSMPGLRFAAMTAAVVLLLGVDVSQTMQLRTVQDERNEYLGIAQDFAHGGRTWYMAGVDQWRGAGGNLVQPANGDPSFVLFHGLRDLQAGQTYALWLIDANGKWVRGSNFRSDGRDLQAVAVGLDLQGFERCAVTVETRESGKPEGPSVMQSSKIVPLTQ